jgi:hypothetical protein
MPHKVFAPYIPELSHLVRLWSRSWEAQGWTPQLISEREVYVAGSIRRALRKRKGRILVSLATINLSRTPRTKAQAGTFRPGKDLSKFNVVRFPGTLTEEEISQLCTRTSKS